MKASFLFVLATLLIVGGTQTVSAQKFADSDLEAKVTDQTKRIEKKKLNNSEVGKGELEIFENAYSADLKNGSLSTTIPNISLRLIAFYMPNDFNSRDDGHEPNKIQIRDKIELKPGEEKKVDFNSEKFETGSATKSSSTLITITHMGVQYAGVVLEVYVNGRLLGVRYDGNSASRKAYDVWVAKKGYLKATEEKPAEAVVSGPSSTEPSAPAAPAVGTAHDPFVPK